MTSLKLQSVFVAQPGLELPFSASQSCSSFAKIIGSKNLSTPYISLGFRINYYIVFFGVP